MTINHRKLQTSQILDKMIVNVNIINHIKKKKIFKNVICEKILLFNNHWRKKCKIWHFSVKNSYVFTKPNCKKIAHFKKINWKNKTKKKHFGMSCKNWNFFWFSKNYLWKYTTNLNKFCTLQEISREKNVSFADFRRNNGIFTQPVAKNHAIQNINCEKVLYFCN